MRREAVSVMGHGPLKRGIFLLALVGVLLLGAGARADAAWCSINSAGSVSFGAYSVFSVSPLDGLGTIKVTCSASYMTLRLTLTAGNSGSFSSRRMTSGANTLQYNLFTNSGRTIIWGDETSGTSAVYATSSRLGTNISVYGRIPAGQDVPVGSYTDTIVLRIDY